LQGGQFQTEFLLLVSTAAREDAATTALNVIQTGPGAPYAPGRLFENVETKSPNPGVIFLTLLMSVLKAIVIGLGKREPGA
jgi:hypothetical protein